MSKVHRRTNYIIKPGFQSRLTTIFILIVIIVANVVGALVYLNTIHSLEETFNDAKIPIEEGRLSKNLLPRVILSEFLSIMLVTFICIIVTHTIAGPVYRMERVARSIGDGDLTNLIKLRPKDELKDLADTMNEMTLGIRNKVIALKEDTAKVREGITLAKSTGDLSHLNNLLTSVEGLEKTLNSFILEKEIVKNEVKEEEEEKDKNVNSENEGEVKSEDQATA